MTDRPLRVYIAGPMTNGDGKSFNMAKINEAIETHLRLIELGYVPHCPQLTVFCELIRPGKIPYKDWLALDKHYIDDSDVVLRLEGDSVGADVECQYAKSCDKRIFYGLPSLLWLAPRPEKPK